MCKVVGRAELPLLTSELARHAYTQRRTDVGSGYSTYSWLDTSGAAAVACTFRGSRTLAETIIRWWLFSLGSASASRVCVGVCLDGADPKFRLIFEYLSWWVGLLGVWMKEATGLETQRRDVEAFIKEM